MKRFIIINLCLLVGACGENVLGEYGGDKCPYSKMNFRGNGIVYITITGSEYPAFYKIDGDKLIFEAGGQAVVLQIDGDTLDGGNIFGRCKKLDNGGIISSLIDNEDEKQQKFNKKDQQEMDRLFEKLSKD